MDANRRSSAPPVTKSTSGLRDRVRLLLGRVARRALTMLEKWLHPWRRRIARQRVAGIERPAKILILCYGNICRSPYAAARLSTMLASRGIGGEVDQGGFLPPDRQSPDMAQLVAGRRGVALDRHRSRLVTRLDAERADLIIVMEPHQARRIVAEFGAASTDTLILGDLDPKPVLSRTIPDPYGQSESEFDAVYQRIDDCLSALADSWSDARPRDS